MTHAKHRKRVLAMVLTAAMSLSALNAFPAYADVQQPAPGDASAVGTLSATLRFDYLQQLEEVQRRELSATLYRKAEGGADEVIGVIPLNTDRSQIVNVGDYGVTVTARNLDGGSLNGETSIGYYDISIPNLPTGDYQLKFTGTGYRSYTTPRLEMKDFSKHVILGTGDATFSVGDFNDDGIVDRDDVTAVTAALGNTDSASLAIYDLNGDGKIDIVDLAYVNHQVGLSGKAEILNTAAIVRADVLDATNLTVDGKVEDLFADNGNSVKLSTGDEGEIAIPIDFGDKPVKMDQVEITSPQTNGSVQKGIATVTVEGEKDPLIIAFGDDTEVPADVQLLSRNSGSTTVTINLGKRVPVKKIVITVAKEDTGDYVVVEQIKFLQDIVPETPVASNTKVRNVSGQPGPESVVLKWSELPNVSGYQVNYGLKGESLSQMIPVEKTSAVVSGLKNLLEYEFTVTPVNGEWTGQPSDPITVIPQPAAVPMPPDFLSVTELDGALRLSWGKAKNATGYRVYYKEKDAASYQKVEGDFTELQSTLTGLTNDTTYELCVSAFNDVGESGKSDPVEGTPKAVSYQEPEGIPTGGRMDRDNLESIALANGSNYDPSQYPNNNFTIDSVADGDYSTHWTSQSYPGGWWLDKTVNFTFKEPMDMNNIVFVPRVDGTYRDNLRLYTITVWHEGDDLTKAGTVVANNLPVKNSPKTTGFATLPFPLEKNVKKVAVKIEQVAYSAVSLSEIIFYHYDPSKDLDKAIADLFADELHMKLADSVTAEKIAALQERISGDEKNYYLNIGAMQDELNLAKALLNSPETALNESRIIGGIESRNAGGIAANQGQGGSGLQPLGVVANAGQEITVYAEGIPEGASVNLTATQYFAEASTWQASLGTLENGRNIFTIPKIGNGTTQRGGSLYLTYTGEQPEGIKLHVRRATRIPMLQLSDWDQLSDGGLRERIGAYVDELNTYVATLPANNLQTQVKNSTEVSMPHVLLSIPAKSAANAIAGSADRNAEIQKIYDTVSAWEQVMDIACAVQGIDDNSQMQSRQNIRYMQMFANAFMYAAGSHVGIGYGSASSTMSGSPTDETTPGSGRNHLFGWGFAHEIGHNMDKLGKAEITNNIYSLMIQTYDGQENTLPSRLENGTYESIFEKTATAYPGASNNVFTQLGMYWQLHLAYDEGEKPMDFYNRFFKAWKAGGLDSSYTYDEKVAVTASKIADRDLSQFFRRWGMQLGEKALEEITELSKEDRAIWYLNDESRRYRLANGEAGHGITQATVAAHSTDDGSGLSEQQVDVTFSSDSAPGTIQGFEIRRNGTPVAFVTEGDIFTDVIGSANNQTFAYTVQSYDKLGNAVGEPADAGEIRIAYDKTVSEDAYEMVRGQDGTITATFSEPTAVSGIKVTNPASVGSYTVSVQRSDSAQPVVAKEGSFEENQAAADRNYYVGYFQKPGAAAGDTRIWTYDAQVITVTGIPEDSQVSFISYAGDNIAFGEDVVMGRLKTDYSYDTMDSSETIPAGTLVITGSYRGDPLFNVLQLEGEYTSYQIQGDDGEQVAITEQRVMPGEVLMFAEVPEDGEVSDISDGFFLFIPDLQNEAELQPGASNCDAASLLPARIRAMLYRTDDPESTASKRLTSSTLWIGTPSADSLPEIILEGVTK